MEPIKDIIGNVLGDLSGHRQQLQPDWLTVWSNLGSLSKGSKPVEFKNGCLTIIVDSSARRMLLEANKAHVLTTLQQVGDVKHIYFKVGKV